MAMHIVAQFDIFKTDRNGNVVWLEVATDLESAKARVEAIGKSDPGEYLILDQHSGAKIAIKIRTDPYLTQKG